MHSALAQFERDVERQRQGIAKAKRVRRTYAAKPR
jgi:hypothetical protein